MERGSDSLLWGGEEKRKVASEADDINAIIGLICRGAGIGRQAGLKNQWSEKTVRVRVPPSALREALSKVKK